MPNKLVLAFLLSLPLVAQYTPPGGGGSSVSLTGGTGISVSPNPITGTGVITNTAPGASPAGSTTEMQYRFDATTFGATSGMTWDAALTRLSSTQTFTGLNNATTYQGHAKIAFPADIGSAIYGSIISYTEIDGPGATSGYVWGATSIIENDVPMGTVNEAFAHNFEVDNYGDTVTHLGGETVTFFIFGPVTNLYGSWIQRPQFSPGSNITNFYGTFVDDFGGQATNPYYSWFDSRGVLRTKEDGSFDGVGQAITALYNPQSPKYTPGAPDYERLIEGEWSGNVAEIGSYAGGTGTPRNFRLLGPTIQAGTASNIANTTFTGAGLNDGVFNGTYTGATLTYCIIIDGTGTPNTFKWGTNGACDNGATTVAITGANQTLSSGVVIKFAATTGHTATNKWSVVATGATVLSTLMDSTGAIAPPAYKTATNCANAASPAACGSSAAGAVAIPTGLTTVTLVVNTTAVTANSEISLTADDSVTIAATTCNNTLATLTGGLAVTDRTPGTSFTITYNGTIATDPLCVTYKVMN